VIEGKEAEMGEQLKGITPQQITQVRSKDLNALTPYVMSPEYAVKDRPEYKDLAGQLVEGQLKQRFMSDAHYAVIDRLKSKIPVKDRPLVRSYIEDLQFSHNKERAANLAKKLRPDVAVAAESIRNMKDNFKARYIDYRIKSFQEHLPQAEQIAVGRVLAGESIRSAVRNTGVKQKDLLERLESLAEVEGWGIEEYITNAERGEYRILYKDVDEQGKTREHTVAIGATRGDAGRKAAEYLADHPEVDQLFVDNRPKGFLTQAGAKLTTKQRRYLEDKIRTRWNDDVEAIAEQFQIS
jgi:hypothetical protein